MRETIRAARLSGVSWAALDQASTLAISDRPFVDGKSIGFTVVDDDLTRSVVAHYLI